MPAAPPPITRVRVRDFQSLADVEVPVGRLTCLVGPSNVGKSAFVRALRAAARNASSTGLVREGAKELSVEVEFGDQAADTHPERETLVKGPKKSEFHWTDSTGEDWVTAKAGKDTVPPDIAAAWALPEAVAGADLTFSTQHDAPFLLAVPGATVDAAVGRLTNAHRLTAASREAGRRAAAAEADAKARQRELEEVVADLRQYTGLTSLRRRTAAARAALTDLAAVVARRDRLAGLTDARATLALTVAAAGVAAERAPDARVAAEALVPLAVRRELLVLTLRERLTHQRALAAAPPPAPPADLLARLDSLTVARRSLVAAVSDHKNRSADLAVASQAARDAELAYADADHTFGCAVGSLETCPTCGQAVTHPQEA